MSHCTECHTHLLCLLECFPDFLKSSCLMGILLFLCWQHISVLHFSYVFSMLLVFMVRTWSQLIFVMGRSQKLFKKRKGGPGRKKMASEDTVEGVNTPVAEDNEDEGNVNSFRLGSTITPITNGSNESKCSASRRKLSSPTYDVNNSRNSMFECETSLKGNVLINIELLSASVCAFMQCKFCNACDCISCYEDVGSRKGLSSKLVFECSKCKEQLSFWTSKRTDTGHFENNLRFVYGLRTIGKGELAGKTLCGIMDLPKGPTRYQNYNKVIHEAVKHCAESSMKDAVNEAIEINEGSTDIPIAIDGTWQRRGHTSLNGVVSATSVDGGKVLDLEVLTKYCHRCAIEKDKEKLKKHQESADCKINFNGPSGGMEVDGAKAIFSRSVHTYGVRYTKYLGDGDSKGFISVTQAKPYGDTPVEKLECIGHVQKRMGTRLRKLRQDLKGKKLDDGKGISGRGRLTDKEIDSLQNYYGQAIRNNTDNLKKMQQAVWAIYFHKLSNDRHPQHYLCPKGVSSWCKFNRAKETGEQYSHQHSLPVSICDAIKPIFRSLADPSLLQKCLHGRTQNPNESFNSMIWNRIPKNVFVGYETLLLGVYDAVLGFNEGNIGRVKVLRRLGIEPGVNMLKCSTELDNIRIQKAEKELELLKKRSRQHARQLKRAQEDVDNDAEPVYGAGMF